MANKKADTPESVLASADAANARHGKRKYQGSMSAGVNPVSNEPGRGTEVPKHAVAGDPTVQPVGTRRQVGVERNGGRYSVIAGINKPVDPTVSNQTMANARTLRPALNRSGNFGEGTSG